MNDGRRVAETHLSDLASALDWPEADVMPSVIHSIRESRTTPPPTRRLGRALAVVALALAITFVVPAGRQAIARLLGVAGIEVVFGMEGDPEWAELGFGKVTTVEEAAGLRGALQLPALLDAPDEVRVENGAPVIVHALWRSGPSLPAVPGTETGLLLTQFESNADRVVFHKALTEATMISVVSVSGVEGLWIEGAPHQVTYPSTDGDVTEVISRLAANVLMWEVEGSTLRLETNLDLDEARRIAESMEPVALP